MNHITIIIIISKNYLYACVKFFLIDFLFTKKDGSGVVGLETQKIAKEPMKFKLREKIVKISSGADHLVFLTVSGDVYTAGNSEHGQLGRISKYNSFRGGRRGSGNYQTKRNQID